MIYSINLTLVISHYLISIYLLQVSDGDEQASFKIIKE
jgi:hypothetical protein